MAAGPPSDGDARRPGRGAAVPGRACRRAGARAEPPPPDAEPGSVALRFGLDAFRGKLGDGWALGGPGAELWRRGVQPERALGRFSYLAPGVTAETATPHGTQRAGLSASLGGTLGTDLHGAGNTGRAMLEDLRLD